MDRKKTMVCLVGAGLIVGLALLLFLAFRPRVSKAVTIDPREHQAVIDHLAAEIEETMERKIIDGYQFRRIDGGQRKQPEASFKVAIR